MKWNFRLWILLLMPAICVAGVLFWVFVNQGMQSISLWGNHTRQWSHWYTAFTGPLLHGDAGHLTGNLISFLGLSGLFVLLFPRDWWRFFWLQWLISSVILFALGDRGAIHIGASTWLYAFASFLSVHALRAKDKRKRALFLVLVLWYGGMWWGLLPIMPGISHEGHISGLLTGILMAFGALPYWERRMLPEWHYQPKDWESEADPDNPYD